MLTWSIRWREADMYQIYTFYISSTQGRSAISHSIDAAAVSPTNQIANLISSCPCPAQFQHFGLRVYRRSHRQQRCCFRSECAPPRRQKFVHTREKMRAMVHMVRVLFIYTTTTCWRAQIAQPGPRG